MLERSSLTPADFHRWLERQSGKFELHAGHIVAFAGGTRAHRMLATRTYDALRAAIDARICEVSTGDFTAVVSPAGDMTFPDVAVSCDDRRASDESDIFYRPRLIVEVVAPSTRDTDLGYKANVYGSLPECQEYLTVDSERRWHHAWRRMGSVWTAFDPSTTNDFFSQVAQVRLPLDDLYAGITPAQT